MKILWVEHYACNSLRVSAIKLPITILWPHDVALQVICASLPPLCSTSDNLYLLLIIIIYFNFFCSNFTVCFCLPKLMLINFACTLKRSFQSHYPVRAQHRQRFTSYKFMLNCRRFRTSHWFPGVRGSMYSFGQVSSPQAVGCWSVVISGCMKVIAIQPNKQIHKHAPDKQKKGKKNKESRLMDR